MSFLKTMLTGKTVVVAPLVFDPLGARLAEQAGFEALYLGGGALGYLKTVTEANLGLAEMVQAGHDIMAATGVPLILDGACGWGDAMHMRRTIRACAAAGFGAIEIEDQIMPKRAHHHVGIEHIIPMDHAVAKVEQAVAARLGTDLMIIARTNAARSLGLDEALRRGEAFRRAGADMLLVLPKTPDQTRLIGERLGPPLMYMTLQGGLSAIGHSADELHQLGYRLVVDPATPLLAAFEAMRCAYREIAAWQPHPALGAAGGEREIQARIHDVIGLEALLEIERKTVEHPSTL